jgi:probable HAF family extracellular repeat protein
MGVSADGAVVVGEAVNAAEQWRAFRWTAAEGMQDLGTLGGDESYAYGVSADGAVVVGWARNAAWQWRAFRWTASGGMQDLGTLGGCCSEAYGVSADGSVVVGWARNAAGWERAFRWTASGGMRNLGTLGGLVSWAYGVSADGSVVVGESLNYAFRWTASRGMEDLNTTCACLLTNGSVLRQATSHLSQWALYCGTGLPQRRNRALRSFLLDTRPRCPFDGDVNGDGIVDDADLLIAVQLRQSVSIGILLTPLKG